MTDATKKTEPESADAHRDQAENGGDRQRDDDTRMREANENIRKSQGDDAGQRPTIDRHR
jgi:hypothetical protein